MTGVMDPHDCATKSKVQSSRTYTALVIPTDLESQSPPIESGLSERVRAESNELRQGNVVAIAVPEH